LFMVAHVHKWYEYDYKTGKIRLLRRKCPRCGSIMAYHKVPVPRHHCGKCGFTIFETQEQGRGRARGR